MASLNQSEDSRGTTAAVYASRRSRRASTAAAPATSQSHAHIAPQPPHSGLEIRSKRRQQIFSSRPYHPDFFTQDNKRRFEKYFQLKEYLVEKSMSIDNAEVITILEHNHLNNCITFDGTFNKTLVTEFYANISDSILDEESPLFNKVFVRGVWVEFSPLTISAALDCPYIESVYQPELERPHISPSFLVAFLTNQLIPSWPDNNSLVSSSSLSSTFAVLLKLCKLQWIPSTHHSSFNQREALLLYLMVSDPESLSFGSIIQENIVDRSIPHQQKKLIHPVLISRLLEHHSVPFRESDSIISIPGPTSSNRRLSQGTRINDAPSSRNNVPPALREQLLQSMIECQRDVQRLQYIIDSLVLQLNDDDGGEED